MANSKRKPVFLLPTVHACILCGCTDNDCSRCIARTGQPCHWIDEGKSICSACVKPSPGEDLLEHRGKRALFEVDGRGLICSRIAGFSPTKGYVLLQGMSGMRDEDCPGWHDVRAVRLVELLEPKDKSIADSFWSDVVSGLRGDAIDLNLFEFVCVTINPDRSLSKTTSPANGAEYHSIVLVASKPVYDQYSIHLRNQGRTTMTYLATCRLVSECSFCLPSKNKDRTHDVRIRGMVSVAWALNVDEDHPPLFSQSRELLDLLKRQDRLNE